MTQTDAEMKLNLIKLRAEIRFEEGKDGILPFVCSDFAISEMARLRPANVDDICAIPSISEDFRHKYAARFLSVLNGKTDSVELAENTDDILRVLNDMSKKLANLSESNFMIRLPSADVTEYMDLSSFNLDFDKIMSGNSVKLCGTSKADVEMRERIDMLMAEIRNGQRDRGHNLLYLAYPFVEGRIEITDVKVRAPLVLFPMMIEKISGTFFLKLDHARDIVVNSVLMLAILDARKDIFQAPDPVLEIELGKGLEALIREKYKDYLKLEGTVEVGNIPFQAIKKSEEYDPEPGFQIVNYAVLGKFSNDSGTLQRDYDAIKSIGVPPLVATLLAKNLKDKYAKGADGEDQFPVFQMENMAKFTDVPDKNLAYISPLNASQEQIISALDTEDNMVIQGPPGTGKSEAITAAIINAVNKGMNVLVVSEKNTALSVIKSRLGTLGKYVLVINNANDKGAFYDQISAFWETKATAPVGGIDEKSKQIDDLVAKLGTISKAVYEPMPGFGISAIELYKRGKLYDFTKSEDLSRFNRVHGAITPTLMEVDYETLENVSKDMSNRELVANTFSYLRSSSGSAGLSKMKSGLRQVDLATFVNEAEAIKGMKKGGFLSKNKERDRALKAFKEKYLVPGISDSEAEALIDSDLTVILADYHKHNATNAVFESYNDVQKEYTRVLYDLSEGRPEVVPDINKELFECILYEHLDDFDAKNTGVIASMVSFNAVVQQIERLMDDKAELEKKSVESKFTTAVQYIIGSKQRADIQNVLYNSANKYPISRFMLRFGDVMLQNIKVWLMTPDAVSDVLPLPKVPQFDLLIFDEASQMFPERGIPAICRAKKVVIAGDQMQLRPTILPGSGRVVLESDSVDDVEADVALQQGSLLDLAALTFQPYLLNCHYRSRYEELIQFSNSAYYGGRLIMSPNSKAPAEAPIEYRKVDGMWHNNMNQPEAEAVANLVAQIVKTPGHGTIGVIAFNLKQAGEISLMLTRMRAKDEALDIALSEEECRVDSKGSDVKIFIENITHIQGDERDIIIFSTTYGKDINGEFHKNFGWLNKQGGENMLNVAITRAKQKVYIVTSMDPRDISSLTEGPRRLGQYLAYSKAVNDYYAGMGSKDAITAVLRELNSENKQGNAEAVRSPMLDQIYEALLNKGYTVERDVGVGMKTIDLAVKNEDGYFAGILADTSVYKEESPVRARDLHDPQYLALRGWNIVRAWTPLYWANPDGEVSRVCSEVDSLKQ